MTTDDLTDHLEDPCIICGTATANAEDDDGEFLCSPECAAEREAERVAHEWYEPKGGLQTTGGPVHPCNGDSSFYLGKEGWVSFSGSLDSTIAYERIEVATDATLDGSFWFFHHGWAGANLGVQCVAPCRVYLVRSVCANCGQWVRPTDGTAGDCFNECARRGFAVTP